MANYIVLLNFTDQGIRTASESPKRYEAFKAVAERMEVKMKSIYWTVGQYDMVATMEGSDEAIAAALLKLGSGGNVRSQTLRAYSQEEIERILKKAA